MTSTWVQLDWWFAQSGIQSLVVQNNVPGYLGTGNRIWVLKLRYLGTLHTLKLSTRVHDNAILLNPAWAKEQIYLLLAWAKDSETVEKWPADSIFIFIKCYRFDFSRGLGRRRGGFNAFEFNVSSAQWPPPGVGSRLRRFSVVRNLRSWEFRWGQLQNNLFV